MCKETAGLVAERHGGPCGVMVAFEVSNGYLAFTSSFSDEAVLLSKSSPEDTFCLKQQGALSQHGAGVDNRLRKDTTATEQPGMAALPDVLASRSILKHALSWNHISVHASAHSFQVCHFCRL